MKKVYTGKKAKRKSDVIVNCTPIEVYSAVVKGKIKKFPNDYMTQDIAKELITHVVINQLNFKRRDICKKLNLKLLSDHKLGGVRTQFDNSIFCIIDYVFPEMKIKQWELNKVHPDFWKVQSNRNEFILWVAAQENLNIKKIEYAKLINTPLILKKHGSNAVKEAGGLHILINEAVGNIFKEWQFVKINSWNEQKIVEAVEWLIVEKKNWSHKDVCNELTAQTFYDNDLGGMLSKGCENSPIIALEKWKPGEYKKEDLVKGENKKKEIQRMKEAKKQMVN